MTSSVAWTGQSHGPVIMNITQVASLCVISMGLISYLFVILFLCSTVASHTRGIVLARLYPAVMARYFATRDEEILCSISGVHPVLRAHSRAFVLFLLTQVSSLHAVHEQDRDGVREAQQDPGLVV
jgi:hypothetical protein